MMYKDLTCSAKFFIEYTEKELQKHVDEFIKFNRYDGVGDLRSCLRDLRHFVTDLEDAAWEDYQS